MTYPITINVAGGPPPTFPAPIAGNIVGACPLSLNRCGIASLGLQGHPQTGPSFTAAPVALAPGAGGRMKFAPRVEAFTVQWALTGHQFIEILRLELYRAGDAVPVWDKTLDYTGGGILANGSTQFDGNLAPAAHVASVPVSNVAVTLPGAAHFPTQTLSAEHSPYKLSLKIIQTANNTQVDTPERWVYLDVMVHDIRVGVGPQAWIPPAPAPLPAMPAPAPAAQNTHYRDTRKHALTVATRAALAADLPGVDGISAGPAATRRIRLTSNTFAKRTDDFYCNTVFTSLLERWGTGPRIPLKATLRIRQSDGNPAPVAAGAPALGNIAVMWDWVSGVPRPPHANARNFVAAARAYKPGDWPHAATNCHHDHGGKRAAPGNLHFEDLPVNTIGAAVPAAVPAAAPAPPGNRPWCHFSRAVTNAANADAGTSGVLFIPSRMAGDTYQLRVHLAYPTPATYNAVDLAAVLPNSVRAESPTTLEVWRRVEVASMLHKDPASADAPNLQWADIQAVFEDVCVQLEAPAAPAPIPAAQFRAACGVVFPTLPPAQRCALGAAVGQDNGIFGLNFENYAAFRANVLLHINAMLVAPGVSAMGPAPALGQAANWPNENSFLDAQEFHLFGAFPPYRTHEDLLIPTRADRARPAAQIRDLVLTNLGITDQASYEAKVKQWADDILPAVSAQHARVNNAGVYGVHLYHYEFLNGLFQQNSVAEASTTVSNFANCPACNAATLVTPPPRGFPDDHRICGTCGLRLDESAHVTAVAPFRYMNGALDQWATANLPRADRIKISVGGHYGTTAAISIAHEIGHTLGMPHAGPEPVPLTSITGAKYPPYHDDDDDACIMSYNFRRAPRLHFCGLCALRLAGWSVGPSLAGSPDRANDAATIQMCNHAEQNRAQKPAFGAAYQANPVVCSHGPCATRFGMMTRPRHCGLCGDAFCSDHARNRRPVRDPVVQNPVENVRVCDDCHFTGHIVPAPGAKWEPDENAYSCALAGCGQQFDFRNRKHHCRTCGEVFCDAHTQHRVNVRRPLTSGGPVVDSVVCDACDALYR